MTHQLLHKSCFAAIVPVLVVLIGCGPSDSPAPRSTGSGDDSSEVADASDHSSDSASSTNQSSSDTTPTKSTKTPSKSSGAGSGAAGSGWGDLRGRFTYAGDAPQPMPLTITKDEAFCGKHAILNESVVVNKENGGLANVVLYLYLKRGESGPKAHESYEESAAVPVSLDNNQCRFEPHVCLIRTNQKLVVGNKDEVGHNTKIDSKVNSPINPITPAGESFEHMFSEEERGPAQVSCSIHPWMTGWVVVRDSPYFAVTDEDGNFQIKNLPAGTWTFQVWHEKANYISAVTINGEKTSWERGRMDVTIKDGETTDLGPILVSSALFQ